MAAGGPPPAPPAEGAGAAPAAAVAKAPPRDRLPGPRGGGDGRWGDGARPGDRVGRRPGERARALRRGCGEHFALAQRAGEEGARRGARVEDRPRRDRVRRHPPRAAVP